jgi:hypothetical protein
VWEGVISALKVGVLLFSNILTGSSEWVGLGGTLETSRRSVWPSLWGLGSAYCWVLRRHLSGVFLGLLLAWTV